MRLTSTADLSASPDAVYAVLVDQAFQEAKCAATSSGEYAATATPEAQGATVTTRRHLPTDTLPDAVRGLIGEELTIHETLRWGAPGAGGARSAAVELRVDGVAVTMQGTVTLAPAGAGGTRHAFEGDLKAKIPFFGGKVEQSASGPIQSAIEVELELLRERLGG